LTIIKLIRHKPPRINSIIKVIESLDGAKTYNEIAIKTGLCKSTVKRVVRELYNCDLVIKKRIGVKLTEDGRRYNMSVESTAEGIEFIKMIKELKK
jgi:predicted transcriptional regulator